MNRQDMVEAGARGISDVFKGRAWDTLSEDGKTLNKVYSSAVLDAVLPQIANPEQLLELPEGSLLVGRDGKSWCRRARKTTPWECCNDGGGYGASNGDMTEITARFFQHEHPLTVVWQP